MAHKIEYDPHNKQHNVLSEKWRPRRWRGHWLKCCGEFSPEDAAGCCLGCSNPCGVAYGWNVSKVLRLSFWREALKYAGLILLMRLLYNITNYSKLYSCFFARIQPLATDEQGNVVFTLLRGPPSAACSAADSLLGVLGLVGLLCVLCWALFVGGKRRRQMREELGIPLTSEGQCCHACTTGSEYCNDDCCLHFWCMPCALAQETRTILHEEAQGSLAPRLAGTSSYSGLPAGEMLLVAPHEHKDMARAATALPV